MIAPAQAHLFARCSCGAPLTRTGRPGRPPGSCPDCRELPSDAPAGALYVSPSGSLVTTETPWRARLWRTWTPGIPRVAFVGLNPSTATAEVLDPTVRRCVGFAKAWGFGGLEMLNLWPRRATDPAELWSAISPPLRTYARQEQERAADLGIRQALRERVSLVVLACGPGSKGRARDRQLVQDRLHQVADLVRSEGRPLAALAIAKGPAPGHPLYLRGDLVPRRWEPGWEALGPAVPLPRDA